MRNLGKQELSIQKDYLAIPQSFSCDNFMSQSHEKCVPLFLRSLRPDSLTLATLTIIDLTCYTVARIYLNILCVI